jgi:hypothetical protein
MATKYTNFVHCETPPKFTQFGIFGLKICHLATLLEVPTFSSVPDLLLSFLAA